MSTASASASRVLHGIVDEVGYMPGPKARVGTHWYSIDEKLFRNLNYHIGHDRKVRAIVRSGHVVAITVDGASQPVCGLLDVYGPDEVVVGGQILQHHGTIPDDVLADNLGKVVLAKVNGNTLLDVFEAVVTRGPRLFGGAL